MADSLWSDRSGILVNDPSFKAIKLRSLIWLDTVDEEDSKPFSVPTAAVPGAEIRHHQTPATQLASGSASGCLAWPVSLLNSDVRLRKRGAQSPVSLVSSAVSLCLVWRLSISFRRQLSVEGQRLPNLPLRVYLWMTWCQSSVLRRICHSGVSSLVSCFVPGSSSNGYYSPHPTPNTQNGRIHAKFVPGRFYALVSSQGS